MRTSAGLMRIKVLSKHAKVGIILMISSIMLILVPWGAGTLIPVHIPDRWMSALLSIPVTLMCMGIFSVIYEYHTRTTFAAYMRSVYSAWNTGVTVFPTHKHEEIPDRSEVLLGAKKEVKLMSTTFSRYFASVEGLVKQKLDQKVSFRFILYNPESKAIEEKADEEGCAPNDFKGEIESVCRRYLGPLKKKFPDRIQIRFCPFNTPFGITIIDDREMVISLNIYGLARSKRETPCLLIKNTYDADSVFDLYESSYEAVWGRLDDTIPDCLHRFFESSEKEETPQPLHKIAENRGG